MNGIYGMALVYESLIPVNNGTLWPQRWGTDGFYICRMRRK